MAVNAHASEVWGHASGILSALESGVRQSRDEAKTRLMALLPADKEDADEDTSKGLQVEDFEYAFHSAVIGRLEVGGVSKCEEAIEIVGIATALVVEQFRHSGRPNAPQSTTDRCKLWFQMLLSIAEDVARLLPTKCIGHLMTDWEISLKDLREAYLCMAHRRLQEFDKKQEDERAAERKAKEEADKAKEKDAEKDKDKKEDKKDDKKDKKDEKKKTDSERTDERKKMITHLGLSPNGLLYLQLTSLLKQLSSRLCSSLHAELRIRVVLLLERLLAMDHKAIANNQKLRTVEVIGLEDLDPESEFPKPAVQQESGNSGTSNGADAQALPAEGDGQEGKTEVLKETANADGENGDKGDKGDKAAKTDATKAKDADKAAKTDAAIKAIKAKKPELELNYEFYKSFWALQEMLHTPERAVERAESWGPFYRGVQDVLSLFKKYPAHDGVTPCWGPPEATPLRHAPRANALQVQFDDTGFRQQFLIQVLIACQALEQDSSLRRAETGGLLAKQSDFVRRQFKELKKACETELHRCKPGLADTMRHVLEREAHWVTWKAHSCREFEHESQEMLSAKPVVVDKMPLKPEKAQREKISLKPYIGGMMKTLKDPAWTLPADMPTETDKLPERMRARNMKRMCDKRMDRLLEEDNPENGIEDEYKMKNNKIYMWQSRRLYCHQHLRIYVQKDAQNRTDFMDFLKLARGLPVAPLPNAKPDAKASSSKEAAAEKEPRGSPLPLNDDIDKPPGALGLPTEEISSGPSAEKPDKTIGKAEAKATEKVTEKPADKPSEKTAEKPLEKAPAERAADKPAQSADKSGKPAKPGDKAQEPAVNPAPDKADQPKKAEAAAEVEKVEKTKTPVPVVEKRKDAGGDEPASKKPKTAEDKPDQK